MKLALASVERKAAIFSGKAERPASRVRPYASGYLLFLCRVTPLGFTAPSHSSAPVTHSASSLQIPRDEALFTSQYQNSSDLERLTHLCPKRIDGPLADYKISPGDVLGISVAAMKELKCPLGPMSRVGMIALPLTGVIHAAGFTKKKLRTRFAAVLKTICMPVYTPQFRLSGKQHPHGAGRENLISGRPGEN